jgi:hypothetical protein
LRIAAKNGPGHKIIPVMKFVAALLVAIGIAAEPRPVSDAERAAVSIVAAYLANGPDVVYDRLAAEAPLRMLPREDAVREIAVRMGPREGATWTLRTAERDAAFQVAWASGYEDGVLLRMRGGEVFEMLTLAEGASDRKAEALPPHSKAPLYIAGLLAITGAVIVVRWRVLGAAVLAIAAAAAVVAYRQGAPPRAPLPFVELRELMPLREALAEGTEPKLTGAPAVASLWMLQSGRPGDASALDALAHTPLAHLLRARLALDRGNEDAAARAFERAAALPPLRDDILHEAAFSFGNDRAKSFLARMASLGSRDADAYYRAARETKSFDALQTAWMLEPRPREELLRASLLNDLRAKSLVSFFSATEPVRRSATLAARALTWPAGAKAIVTGELLRVEIGRATLEVPNGAALAPKNAQVVAATYGAEQRETAALREAQELLEHGSTASRTHTVRAVKALAQRNRWADVLTLTNDITGTAPADLLVLRLHALLRANRDADARALADSKGVRELRDSTRAHIDARMQQLALRRAFASKAHSIATKHFEIRHDPSINPAIASRIGDLLEAELARVQRKLPPFEPQRVTVNVLRWDEFRNDITRSDHVFGLYDGEILFPFAAIEQFKPEVVAIITHELTHALLAQVTRDRAPRWFQEGVATRMELLGRQENAFASTPVSLVLPIPLLDAMMEKNTDPSTYAVAQTFIRFLEDRYGEDAIARLAADFARGEDAVAKLTGKSLDALNADFRQWGFHHNGEFVSGEPWPYRDWYSPDIDPRIRAGFKFRDQ